MDVGSRKVCSFESHPHINTCLRWRRTGNEDLKITMNNTNVSICRLFLILAASFPPVPRAHGLGLARRKARNTHCQCRDGFPLHQCPFSLPFLVNPRTERVIFANQTNGREKRWTNQRIRLLMQGRKFTQPQTYVHRHRHEHEKTVCFRGRKGSNRAMFGYPSPGRFLALLVLS